MRIIVPRLQGPPARRVLYGGLVSGAAATVAACGSSSSPGTAAGSGGGVQSSLLGTVKSASGSLYVTYNHWPLYTYAGDSGPGAAHGQGITGFGGTWYVLNASGTPVTSAPSTSGSSPSSGGGGGYGY